MGEVFSPIFPSKKLREILCPLPSDFISNNDEMVFRSYFNLFKRALPKASLCQEPDPGSRVSEGRH